jgi:outer membrane protein assembly factor BamB
MFDLCLGFRASMRGLLFVLLLAMLDSPARADDGGAALTPVTFVSDGSYAIARLDLSSGLTGTPQKLFVALRDGRLANLWFVMPIGGDQRLNVEKSSLTLTSDALKGTVHLRTAVGRERPIIAGLATFDLAVNNGRISGSYELDMGKSNYKSGKGTATGTLSQTASTTDAVSPAASWASFGGTKGDMSAQSQSTLVEDLAQARPVWRSETHVPTSYGNAPDSRYFIRALITGNGGGGSSPVVAAGMVFMSYYVPSESVPPSLKNPFWERTYKDDAAFQKQMADMNANAQETNWVLSHFRPVADDHIVAIDAATGATKWRTVLPRRSPNLQTHKHRGTSGVPLVSEGTLYVPNLGSRLYAVDAATGKVKWERPAFDGSMKEQGINEGPPNPSPLLIGDLLIWARGGQLYGLDPTTGQEKWKTSGGYTLPWNRTGKERLVTFAGRSLVCLDAATGKTIWNQETDLAVHAPLSAVIAGDVLMAAPPLNKQDGTFRFRGLQLSESGVKELWQAAPFAPDENMPITIVGDRAFLLGKQTIHVVEIATGKTVAERNFTSHGPGSNAWLGIVGERFLFLPEGQHGTAQLGFLDRNLKSLGSLWLPTNTDTTAYNSQPVVYPIVDGRLFVRGGDGVYCYDLRK